MIPTERGAREFCPVSECRSDLGVSPTSDRVTNLHGPEMTVVLSSSPEIVKAVFRSVPFQSGTYSSQCGWYRSYLSHSLRRRSKKSNEPGDRAVVNGELTERVSAVFLESART
jgi:hypothetical protein